MSFHHYRRLTEHSELSNLESLTAVQALIATTLAMRQNDNPAKPFRASARYLAEVTGRSENAISKACQALVDLGLFSSESTNRRRGNIYLLTIECPSDCRSVQGHYTIAERAIRKTSTRSEPQGANSAVMDDLDTKKNEKGLSNNIPSTHQQGVLIEQIEHIEHIEPNKTFDSQQPFSYEEFSDYLWEIVDYSEDGQQVVLDSLADDGRPYEIALGIIRDAQSQRRVSNPLAYIGKIFLGDKPLRLLAGAPGSKPRNPKFKTAEDGGALPKDYEQAISALCGDLGIDYQSEFSASYRDRDLRDLHNRNALTLSAVVGAYNSVREPSEHLELIANPY